LQRFFTQVASVSSWFTLRFQPLVACTGEPLMTASTLSRLARATPLDEQSPFTWTNGMTKSEAEFLLDQFEEAGVPGVEICCTRQGLFAIHLPRTAAVAGCLAVVERTQMAAATCASFVTCQSVKGN
jgi:hypothetical protein